MTVLRAEVVLVTAYAAFLLAAAAGFDQLAASYRRRVGRLQAHRATEEGEADDVAGDAAHDWPHCEILHFYRGFSLVLVVLAGFLAGAQLVRHHQALEVAVLAVVLVWALHRARRGLRSLRASPVRFPS